MENAALSNLTSYARESGLTHTQELRLRLAVESFLEDRSRKLTPENIDFAIERVAGAEADTVRETYGVVIPDHCFLPSTVITMWPRDPALRPCASGTYDEAQVRMGLWTKPISEIVAGDVVLSYDASGRLIPGPVMQTMVNRVAHVLDFWGTGVTPGHVYLCAEGRFEGQHVPLMDILRSDGAIMRADGTKIRAATGCDVGSKGDAFVWAILPEAAEGYEIVAPSEMPTGDDLLLHVSDARRIRMGARITLPDGRDISVLEVIKHNGGVVDEDGYITLPDGMRTPFLWTFSDALPAPEDYVLARSAVTLEAIYEADEWEQVAPAMPMPHRTAPVSSNADIMPNVPPAFADREDAPIAARSGSVGVVH